MKWLRTIINFYIDSSIHVALSVISLMMISGIFLSISVPDQLIIFVFFATISCYNLLKYGTGPNTSLSWGRVYGYAIIFLSVISFFIAVWCAFFMSVRMWVLLGVLIVLTVLYIIPVLPRERNLRSLGIVKVILVGLSWTAVTVYLPLVAEEKGMDWDISVFSLQRFLLIIALIIPFEIRDMILDPPQIRTIPRRIGVVNTKGLGVLLVLITFVLTFLRDEYDSEEIVARLVLLVVLSLVLWKAPKKNSEYYASFWVESIPIFWYGLIYILYYFF